jgi:hypothetical protein
MKLIYFLLVVLAIYFIATSINLVHINSLGPKQQKELKEKSKFKSYMANYVKCDSNESNKLQENFEPKENFAFKENEYLKNSELYSAKQYNSPNYKHDYFDLLGRPIILPGANDLFILIRSEFIDSTYHNNKYKFNLMGLPVTNRYPNKNTLTLDKKYVKKVKQEINQWNNIFPRYYNTSEKLIHIQDIKPIFIMETDFEFVIQTLVKLLYRGKTMHFYVEYYGQINKTDDILNGAMDTYDLQLIGFKPISKKEYESQPFPADQEEMSAFMPIEKQRELANKVKQMHINETGIW